MWAHLFEIRATILHLAAWSGVSASILVGLGFLAFMLPEWRAIALRGGIVVAIAWATFTYGYHLCRVDMTAQQVAADARAAVAKKQIEDAADANAEKKYTPVIAQLQREADEHTKQGATYETWILGNLASGNLCAVGPRGLQLRGKAR